MKEYKVIHFRDKWYICENDEIINRGYSSKEYAEQCLKEMLKEESY